jgi:hypothetical protein
MLGPMADLNFVSGGILEVACYLPACQPLECPGVGIRSTSLWSHNRRAHAHSATRPQIVRPHQNFARQVRTDNEVIRTYPALGQRQP